VSTGRFSMGSHFPSLARCPLRLSRTWGNVGWRANTTSWFAFASSRDSWVLLSSLLETSASTGAHVDPMRRTFPSSYASSRDSGDVHNSRPSRIYRISSKTMLLAHQQNVKINLGFLLVFIGFGFPETSVPDGCPENDIGFHMSKFPKF